MLSTIRDFFERNIAGAPAQGGHSIELATAALLVEVMRIDAGTTAAERAAGRKQYVSQVEQVRQMIERAIAIGDEPPGLAPLIVEWVERSTEE